MTSCSIATVQPDLSGHDSLLSSETANPPEHFVSALVGLGFEARIAAGPGVYVICRDDRTEIASSLELAMRKGCRSYISFGVAGGLAPNLRPGDWIVASSIVDARQVRPTDRTWSERLLEMIPGASYLPIAGVDAPVAGPEAKRNLHVASGAAAVDMESHHVARLASTYGLSFAAVRVVIDPAHRVVPKAALAGMPPNGGVGAVIRELIARPLQLAGLLRLAADAYAARNALLRVRRTLGPAFGRLETAKT